MTQTKKQQLLSAKSDRMSLNESIFAEMLKIMLGCELVLFIQLTQSKQTGVL